MPQRKLNFVQVVSSFFAGLKVSYRKTMEGEHLRPGPLVVIALASRTGSGFHVWWRLSIIYIHPLPQHCSKTWILIRFSNTVLGVTNLIALLASIPIIGAGLWMARNTTTCESFLQTPLLIIGFGVLVISLAGFIGACFHVTWALWLYLIIMVFLIGGLMIFTVFGLIVTNKGGGVEVSGRLYKEYKLENYSPWLRERIKDPKYWLTIKSCIVGSKTCAKIQFWTPYDYQERTMSPIQSGCCKPPTACNYDSPTVIPQDPDCYKWNNAQNILCYDCDSCKAGVLENIKVDWHKLSVLNIFMLVLLIGIYTVACCAFRNSKRSESNFPFGQNRMTKARPRWDFYW